MKAYLLNKTGGPQVLNLSECPSPTPGPDEVVVRTEHIGLNYAEVQSRKGLYGWAPKRPYILGMEASGKVLRTGDQVNDLSEGEDVIVVGQYGAYAEEVIVHHSQVLPVVPGYTAQENAAFAVQFMTAWVGLMEICRLRSSDKVLVQAAAGGVGTAAVMLSKGMGCQVFGTTSSDEKIDKLRELGIDMAINYTAVDFAQKIREYTGSGVDVVIEVVGGDVFRRSLDLLEPFGRMAVIGFASLNLNKLNPFSWYETWKAIPRVKIDAMAKASQTVGASHLGYLLKDTDRMMKVWRELVEFVTAHDIHPIIGHQFGFGEMAAAHQLMESRRSHGKIVVSL